MNFCDEFECGDYLDENLHVVGKKGGSGVSGFGVIYYVFNSKTNVLVVLKTLQSQFHSNINKINEFKEEGLISSKLKHHNILKCMGIWELNHNLFLIEEPVLPMDKTNVSDYFDEISEEKAINWAIQFCCGMEYAVDEGIKAHRDIKPSNILVSFDTIKICDFGLADFYEKIHKNNDFEYGTYEYLAPESFNRIFNQQTDIYSFGITLYQMINEGKFPFEFKSNNRGEWKKFHEKFTLKYFDSILFPIIQKCLNKNPDNRYSSFNELKEDLNKLYNDYFNKTYIIPKVQDINPMDYIGEGCSYLLNNNLSGAQNAFKKAIQLNPMSIETYLYCGIALIQNNKSFEAIGYFENCERLLNNNDFNDNEKATIYFNMGHAFHSINLKKSLEYYEKCIKKDDSHLKAYVNMGNIYLEWEDYSKSLEYYDVVLKKDMFHFEANLNKAIVLFKLKKYDESTKYFNKALDNKFREDVVYSEWGRCFRDIGEESKAQDKFIKAININPISLQYNYDMFISHLILKKPFLAMNKYNRMVELNNDINIKFELIRELDNYGYNDCAIKLLDEIIDNDEYLIKSDALILKSDLSSSFDEKVHNLNLSIQYISNNIFALLKLGQLYKSRNLDENSMEIYEKILRIDSNNREALAELGVLHLFDENFDSACSCLEKANNLGDPNPYIHFYLILLYILTENQSELIKYLEEFKKYGFADEYPEFNASINAILGCE